MTGVVDLANRITELLAERMHLRVPSPDTDLIRAGLLDSLSFVELLRHLEAELDYRVRVEELEIDQFRTVARIAEHVAVRRGSSRGAGEK